MSSSYPFEDISPMRKESFVMKDGIVYHPDGTPVPPPQ